MCDTMRSRVSHLVTSLTTTAVDYNSWVESEKGLKLAASLDKDVVLAEGITQRATELCLRLTAYRIQGVRHRPGIPRGYGRLAEE